MVNFIVCDDNKPICKNIVNIIDNIMMKNKLEYKIHSYYDYDKKFMKIINNKMSNKIYILDIETPSASGIDVVRKIREVDVDSIIIFLTSHDELGYVILKQEFLFLSFICKFDDYENKLKSSIKKALEMIGQKQVLNILDHNSIYTIPLKDILYITRDSVDRKIIVITDYSEFKMNRSLNDIYNELNDDFVFSHRSCIVNKDRICKIISINIEYFLDDKYQKNENNKNILILFSNKDESDLDIIIEKYIIDNDKKYETSFLLLNNIILVSNSGYSFKKLSTYKKEGDNKWIKFLLDYEDFPFSDREIHNILLNYKDNCNNIKIEQKNNKFYIYNDDCNKEQLDLYLDDFKNTINNDDNYKYFIEIKKIKNGYCIKNILNYKALFISKIIKEMVSTGKKPKFIIFFGFKKTDEIIYDYLDKKKSIIEKHIKEEINIYCLKLIEQKNSLISEKEQNNSEEQLNVCIKTKKKYNNLYYNDDIAEIISLFKTFADLENADSKS